MTNTSTPKNHKLFGGSSYDRYLDILLFMWPDIKEKYPDAELHIAYGWNLFDQFARTNPERMKWKEGVMRMMQQDGIYHYGRIGKKELEKIRKQCGIWAYPTYFTEINCITALECQRDGVVPVTMTLGALNETVGSGVKIDGDIRKSDVKDQYLEALLDMMGDKDKWKKESTKGKKFAKNYYWKDIATSWTEEFEKPISKPKVSVITITIREGFWNIMAENLSKQTYKNFEWVIVDDHKEDRSGIARKYAEQYGLAINYIRGDKTLKNYKKRYGLVRANNKAWKKSTGELLVFLQDFILIPQDGIERLVDVYQHNKDALLAPTDVYYHCTKPNQDNKEDWFDGNTDVITKLSWKNIRNQHKGLRKTKNPYDFEMNWSAIPKHILDKLNGWWEWFDDGLGFDNTEIAYRALESGYKILIDDTNVAKCIDLWPHIGGTAQNISERERHLNLPGWKWFEQETKKGDLPLIRDEKLDQQLTLEFTVPSHVKDDECTKWIHENADRIVKDWNDRGISGLQQKQST